MGRRYPEEYILMQIMDLPTESDNSVLYINTNAEYLYERYIFTKKMILPAYSNGYSPCLNADALIFDGKSYSVIPEFGDDIENITSG